MPNNFVNSKYPRIPGDYYPTIDARVVYALMEHYPNLNSAVDVCAPQGSGIVDAIQSQGQSAYCVADAFTPSIGYSPVVTNPPYSRPLVDQIVRRQIERIAADEIPFLAVLLRANFDFAKSRKDMFESPHYVGQIRMRFRPWWSEARDSSPIHNFVWHIWEPIHTSLKTVRYSDGNNPQGD